MSISYIQKDALLKYLTQNCQPESFQQFLITDITKATNLSVQDIGVLLSYFQRNKLIGEYSLRVSSPVLHIVVFLDAFEFFHRGGYTLFEQILLQETQKLMLEIENLKPSIGARLEKVTAIANNIIACIATFAR